MLIVNNRKDVRQYLEKMMKEAAVCGQKATTIRDRRFYGGMMAGIQHGIDALDSWDKCHPNTGDCVKNPQEECPVCAHCKQEIPENPQKGTWGYNGFCGPACCLHYLLTMAGVNNGISGLDAIMGRKAIEEMRNGSQKQKD